MEFKHKQSFGTVNRSVHVIDGPVMPHPSSSTHKRIRVAYVSFIFRLKDGEWDTDGWSSVQMGGVVLKKDGTEGKETWGGTVHYGWDKMPQYDWVRLLRDAVRPEGAPALPFRLNGIEPDDLETDHG